MNIKILSDSTCDLPKELVERFDIGIVPLFVIKNEEEFLDCVSIYPKDIFAHVAAGGNLCSTAARSVGTYQEEFAKYADKYDGIIHINIGAEFSSSHQNACLAATEFDNVRVVDSRNLSTGQGLLVLKAAELAKTAASLDELKDRLDALTEKVEASFIPNQLNYLVKGGRCSSAAALGANLLKLKPCIEVRDGKMSVGKKYRGDFVKCLTAYIKDRLDGREDLDTDSIIVTYTQLPEGCMEAVMEAVNTYGHFRTVYLAEAGCTVSCHCGPSTMGIMFARK